METPSSRIVSEANTIIEATDPRGRVIKAQRINSLDRMRLFKALGPALSANAQYLGMATLARMVIEVDGAPLPIPRNEAMVEAAIGTLGDDGISAIGEAIAKALGMNEEADGP